jgi:hypothetical protein
MDDGSDVEIVAVTDSKARCISQICVLRPWRCPQASLVGGFPTVVRAVFQALRDPVRGLAILQQAAT